MDELLQLLTELAASLKKNKAIKVLECEIPVSVASESDIIEFKKYNPRYRLMK